MNKVIEINTIYIMRITKKGNINFIKGDRCKKLKKGDKAIRFTREGDMKIISTYVKDVDTNKEIESGSVGSIVVFSSFKNIEEINWI